METFYELILFVEYYTVRYC